MKIRINKYLGYKVDSDKTIIILNYRKTTQIVPKGQNFLKYVD